MAYVGYRMRKQWRLIWRLLWSAIIVKCRPSCSDYCNEKEQQRESEATLHCRLGVENRESTTLVSHLKKADKASALIRVDFRGEYSRLELSLRVAEVTWINRALVSDTSEEKLYMLYWQSLHF